MKLFTQLLMAALLVGTATFAKTPAKPTSAPNPVVTTGSYKVAILPSATSAHLNVYIERNPGQIMSISVKAMDGTVLAKRIVSKKQGNLHLHVNMLEVEDGTYKVEITSGNDSTTHVISMRTKPAQEAARTITLN